MHGNECRTSALKTHQIGFRPGLRPPTPLGKLTSLLQLYVVKQIFKISASEYLKYTRKYAIFTLNNQKFSGEGAGASILRPYRHFFLSISSPAINPPKGGTKRDNAVFLPVKFNFCRKRLLQRFFV